MGLWGRFLLAAVVGVFLMPPMPTMGQESTENALSGGKSSRSSRSSRSSSRSSSERGETTDEKSRDRSDKSKSRETNSRSSRRSRENDKDKKEATPAKKETKTVEGAKKPAAGSKSGSGSSGGKPATKIAFEMQVDPETNIMYLEGFAGDRPSLNVSVLENKIFVTRLALYNPKSSEFSQVDASIKYDPLLVRPVGVDDGAISGNLENPSRVLVNQSKGLLSFAADFKAPRTDSFLTIAKIQWKALEPVANTPVAFVNTAEHPSGVFNLQGENILHMRNDGTAASSSKAGLLDATVSIEAANGSIELADTSNNPFSAVALATNITAGTAEGGVQLSLSPRKDYVQVGEDFLVDVLYRNPKRADMDSVKLQVRFDPNVLSVIDTDEGNWITRGINIFDGAYHDTLPFDYHRKNTVSNSLGLIVYEMGFGSRTPVPAEGVIATINFRAIAPAASTSVAFSVGGNGPAAPDTTISFLGFNLIGKPGQRDQAMSNAAVSIRAN